MKLVLASQGFTTPQIASAVSGLADKPLEHINIAIINESYTGISSGRDEKWLINELLSITQYVHGVVSFVNLRAYDIKEIEQRLDFADVIYIVGGAQGVLPKLFIETGFGNLLHQLSSKKVIMGTSAGANVLGKNISNPAYWQDQYGQADTYLAYPALGIVDLTILPHWGRSDKPQRTIERLYPLLADAPFPIYAINDEQAVIVDNGNVTFIGGEPAVTFGQKTNNVSHRL